MRTLRSTLWVFGVTAAMVVVLCNAGCGGSAGNSTGSSTSGDTVNITGTVYAPSGLTGNLSVKGLHGGKAITEGAATGLTCALFTFAGEHVGSAESGSDGSFTIRADLATLRPAGASTAWSERVAVRCRNANGSVEVQTYAEISVAEGTTTSVSVGDLTSVTTQATLAVRRVLDCDWTAGACTVPETTDPSCLFAAQRAIFDEADGDDDGVEQAAGEILRVVNGLQAAGVSLEDLGYDSIADFVLALRSGAVESARLESIAGAVASLLDLEASAIVTRLQSAAALMSATDTILGQTIAGTVGQSEQSGTTLCAAAEADATFMEALMAPLLAATSAEELTETYSAEGAWAMVASVVGEAAEAGTLESLLDAVDDLDAYLALYNGDFSSVYVEDTVDATTVVGLLGVIADQDTTASAAEQREFMEGWQRLIVADGGWTEFVTDGTYNDELADFVCANFYDDSFDPDTFDFTDFAETIDSVDATVASSSCDDLTTYDERLACYDQSVGDVEGGEMVDAGGEEPAAAVAPTVSAFDPVDGSSVMWSHSLRFAAVFSDDMSPGSLTSEAFTLEAVDAQGTVTRRILGTISYDATRREAVFTPADIYEVYSGQTYRCTLAASITNTTGTSLGVPYSWTFMVTY